MNGFTRPALFAAALALTGLAGAVQPLPGDAPPVRPIVQRERGFETDSSAVLMPTSENGTITVNQCTGCRAERLTVDARTRYVAGTQNVTLAVLKTLLPPGRITLMTVYADPIEPVALRVVAHVAAPPATRR
jgi:hypothetical protein